MRIKKFNEFDILNSISESRVYFLENLVLIQQVEVMIV